MKLYIIEVMDYELIRSDRKTLSIEVKKDKSVVVRAPMRCSKKIIDAFVASHEEWVKNASVKIDERLREAQKYEIPPELADEYKRKAAKFIPPLVEKWSRIMNLQPSYVKITSASTRYGSCNSKNGLCFSYRVMAYPTEEIEYVVVHELAHIVHKNHSSKFYGLIKEYLPDYAEREKILKHKGVNNYG